MNTETLRRELTPLQATRAKEAFFNDTRAQILIQKVVRLETDTVPAVVVNGSNVEVEHKFKSATLAALKELAIQELESIWQAKLKEAAKL